MNNTCRVAGVRPLTIVLARAIILLSFLIGVLMAGSVSAQVDTTPPVLLDFKISPVLFDTSQGDVRIDACVTVADDLSGVDLVQILSGHPPTSPILGFFGSNPGFAGAT